jgi:hypothetical protein
MTSEVARQSLQSGGIDHERATGEGVFYLDVSLSMTFPEGTWEKSREKVDDAVLVEAAICLHERYETRTSMSLGTRSRLDEQCGMSLSPGPAFVVVCQEKKKKRRGQYG